MSVGRKCVTDLSQHCCLPPVPTSPLRLPACLLLTPSCIYLHRCKQAVVLLLSTAVFSITRSLEAEPLLACVTSGMLLANKR
jgi:hypothetical protein